MTLVLAKGLLFRIASNSWNYEGARALDRPEVERLLDLVLEALEGKLEGPIEFAPQRVSGNVWGRRSALEWSCSALAWYRDDALHELRVDAEVADCTGLEDITRSESWVFTDNDSAKQQAERVLGFLASSMEELMDLRAEPSEEQFDAHLEQLYGIPI